MTPPQSTSEPRRRAALALTLRAKLLLAVCALSAVMLAFLLAYLGPHAEHSFVARSESLIAKSAEGMRAMAAEHSSSSREILSELIGHSADARRRALQDLPLALYGGDVERIRTAIEAHDADRAARLLSNVSVLGRELERRSAADIDRHLDKLAGEQQELAAAFGSDLRWSYVLLSGGLLAALIGLLGIGLERFIVRPVQVLRRATRRVAAGDLAVEIGARSADEVGDLAGDFAAMVDQLRASRDEIREKNERLASWNHTLQEEVERKTRHLQAVQRDLVQAEKMASIGTLAGGIAHEFNNLIGGIRGCIDDALQDETSPQRREPLEVARRATERAAAVTGKLLRFARPRLEGAVEVSIGELIGEVVELVEPQARRQGVAVETRIGERLAVTVDPGEMHQVFLNLLTNALQAMPDGGRLVVDAALDGDSVRIRVADTGVGIVPSEISHVFDPFYTTKTRESGPDRRGTGLGLAVSYGIVEAHGGVLGVESRPGQGATFTVTLPVHGPRRETRG